MSRLGWALSGLFALFMLGASVAPKLLGMAVAQETMAALGWPEAPIVLIGSLELLCTLLFLFPPTGVLGAVLMMAILGGAMVTQIRAGSPLYSHVLFGIYLGVAMWGGLILRDARVRAVFPYLRQGAIRRPMEPLVDCVIEDERWAALGLEPLALRAVQAALAVLGLPETGFTLAVLGCDDARIAVLNAAFRDKPTSTNVLSWPYDDLGAEEDGGTPDLPDPGDPDDPASLGDIAIAYETCAHEAAEAGKPMADHVSHLIVHGLLHCLGYDHIRDADAAVMEAAEVRILATLGISDPY